MYHLRNCRCTYFMKQILKYSAASLSLLSASIAFAHANTDVVQLQQVGQLEQSLKQLKSQLAQLNTINDASLSDTVADPEEEIEADEDQSFITRAELQGLQSDLENYKYQVQRERETKTALSTRQLLINGVVQAKVSYLD